MPVDLSKLPKDEKSGLPVVEAPKGRDNASIPEAVRNSTFEDFEVEQLPEQGKTEEAATKVEPKKEEPVKEETVEAATEAEEPKVEETKEESTVEEPKDPLEGILKRPGQKTEEKGKEKPLGLPKKEPVRRDYTGYGEEDISAFKKMSDEGYVYTTKKLAELKTLKEGNYLQHERAYTLSPEFQEIQTTARLATFEEKYWKDQLIKMDAGQDCIPLQGYDNKTGRPVYGDPIKTSKALEEEVRQALYNASNTRQQVTSKLQEFPTRYKQTVQNDLKFIDDYRKGQFAWANDPTMMDATIDVGGQEKSLKQVVQDVESMIPAYMRSHPLVKIVADLAIATRIQRAQLAKFETTKATTKTKTEEADLVEPSSKNKGVNKDKGELVHGMKTFSVDPNLV